MGIRSLAKYVNEHPNTLLVVTADHETGGTAVGYRTLSDAEPVQLTFSTKGHTGTVVPIFAYGKGAQAFGAVLKNTDIPRLIEDLMR